MTDSVSLVFNEKKGGFNVDDPAFLNFVGSSQEEAKRMLLALVPILKSKAAKAKKMPWIIQKCPFCACCCCCCLLGSLVGQFGEEMAVEVTVSKVFDLHREQFRKNKIDVEFKRIQDSAEENATVENIVIFKVYVEPPPQENPQIQMIKNPNEEMNVLNPPNRN